MMFIKSCSTERMKSYSATKGTTVEQVKSDYVLRRDPRKNMINKWKAHLRHGKERCFFTGFFSRLES